MSKAEAAAMPVMISSSGFAGLTISRRLHGSVQLNNISLYHVQYHPHIVYQTCQLLKSALSILVNLTCKKTTIKQTKQNVPCQCGSLHAQ